jgi:predicted GNAT family acetyltransferase
VQQHRGICWAIDPPRRDDPRLVEALAELTARQVRFSETVFGPEREVAGVVELCRAAGVDTVELRRQQMMACPAPRSLVASPSGGGFVLRSAVRRDMDWLLAAHGAMCLEDLGVDQVSRNPESYARYFDGLARLRRIVVGELCGRPVFKAEIALESREAWLIEGVYTAPGARGQGCATRAMLWLAEMAQRYGRTACLYVNRCNEGAIRVYRRVGFEDVSPWATALLMRRGRRPGPSS